MLWPGAAEELVGAKAWYIKDGYFKKRARKNDQRKK